jgi:UDP-3-O-[3-hydroxymyristoyl] N-acetylglucosamine deacetylase
MNEVVVEQIAPARTFTFLKDVEMLRQNGLASAARSNAIVLRKPACSTMPCASRTSSSATVLDAINDLALVGYPVIGHLVAHRAGHALHGVRREDPQDTHAWLVKHRSKRPHCPSA